MHRLVDGMGGLTMSGRPIPHARWALLLLVPVLLAACDWAQFGYDAAHTGANPGESAIARRERRQSARGMDGRHGRRHRDHATVVKGLVYVGSSNDRLYTFDAGQRGVRRRAATCLPVWKSKNLHGDIHSTPAVANGLVYVSGVGQKVLTYDAAGSAGCATRRRRGSAIPSGRRRSTARSTRRQPSPVASSTSPRRGDSSTSSTRSTPPGSPTAPGRQKPPRRSGPRR